MTTKQMLNELVGCAAVLTYLVFASGCESNVIQNNTVGTNARDDAPEEANTAESGCLWDAVGYKNGSNYHSYVRTEYRCSYRVRESYESESFDLALFWDYSGYLVDSSKPFRFIHYAYHTGSCSLRLINDRGALEFEATRPIFDDDKRLAGFLLTNPVDGRYQDVRCEYVYGPTN